MTSKRIFLLKQLLWFLRQLYKIIKITLIFFVTLLYDCSDLLWFVLETLKHSLIFVETLTENQFRSIPYLDSTCELSNVLFALGGHSTTTWTKFDPNLTTYLKWVDNCGQVTYSLVPSIRKGREDLINREGGRIFSFITWKTVGRVDKFSAYYIKNSYVLLGTVSYQIAS